MLKNDVFLKALKRQPTSYTPVWMMRQAGRYLPEYNATRSRAGSFLNLAKNPELACEVTLQPLERFDLDAAILFSDILTIPDAMGLGLSFTAGEGPRFEFPLQDEASIKKLRVANQNDLKYVFDAVKEIRVALDNKVPLIGFTGSPWTLACYMVEGAGSSDYRQIKTLMYTRPDLLEHILEINTLSIIDYLNEQIRAGAQAVMIFDSWGGVMADGLYQRYSLRYMQKIVAGIIKQHQGEEIPSIIFTKGGGMWLEEMSSIGAHAIGLDWTVNLHQARQRVKDSVALQGNLDPMTLFGSDELLVTEVQRIIDSFGPVTQGSGHIFNLGHGISQFTDPNKAKLLVDTVHEYSKKYHI